MCPLSEQVDGAGDHVFNRGDRGHVRLIAARGAQQIDHFFGRIDARDTHVALRIGVRDGRACSGVPGSRSSMVTSERRLRRFGRTPPKGIGNE